MIKDYSDGNKVIVPMFKGTTAEHAFFYQEPSGSFFNWDAYNVTAEGRLAVADQDKDFDFPVGKIDDDAYNGLVGFPAALITTQIRETKVYWKVVAVNKTTQETKILCYGELWLKEA